MKKSKRKLVSILLKVLVISSMSVSAYAHQGKTDSYGGHKDKENKSGLGSYHYHCGGNPAHLHTNGVCPYSSDSSTSKSSASSSSATNTKVTSTESTTIDVTDIKINENVTGMQTGESKELTVTITPDNATNKNVTWKSSDENIATVDSTGKVVAKKDGMVDITVESSNGKKDVIKIKIEELQKEGEKNAMNISTNVEQNITENIINENEDNSNLFGGILTLALLGGGYCGYKRLKK